MKTGDLATRLDVSENTIRNWARDYADFLSKQGRGLQPGATREFSQDDVLVMATIARHRDMGLTHEQITEILRKGTRESIIPPPPEIDEEHIRERIELVPRPEAEIEVLRSQLQMVQRQFDQVLSERDLALRAEREARDQIEELHGQIHDLQEQIGNLKAEAARMDERASRIPELEQQIEELREQLEEARKRRGLFGR